MGGGKKINEKQKDRNVRTKIDNVNGTRVQMNINNDIYCIPNGWNIIHGWNWSQRHDLP